MAIKIDEGNLDSAEYIWGYISEDIPEETGAEFPYNPQVTDDLILSDLQKRVLVRGAKIRWCNEKGITLEGLLWQARGVPGYVKGHLDFITKHGVNTFEMQAALARLEGSSDKGVRS